jgi:hypothetical protein
MEQESTSQESKTKVGRPPIWDDPEAFAEAVDKYFEENELSITWSGLALYLGFESRQSLEDYKKKEGFSYPIKKALLRIESHYEQSIQSRNPAGAIFALKNFGWKDKQEVESHTDGKMEVIVKYEKNRGQSS